MKWVQTQLIPNLPENSVLVVDNAAYHNVLVEKNVTSGSKKSEMIHWLQEKNIQFDESLTKPELYDIIQQNKFRFPVRYKLDELMESHGHSVLRLPPYHPELNPIEKIWATVKNWVAVNNTTFKLADVETLTRQKFAEIGEEVWSNICRHVKTFEEELIQKERIFDETIDRLEFVVNTGSSSEDFDSSEDEDLGVSVLESDSN